MNLRIGYSTGEYPRATDTFIQREVEGLRGQGVHVQTFSVRRPRPEERVSAAQEEEQKNTIYLLPPRVGTLLWSHLRLLFTKPKRYASGWALALRTRAPGVRGLVWQIFYVLEAGVLAEHVRRRGLVHVHNHFANSSCSVTMLAAHLGGFTFSVTVHGPAIFFEPARWRLDEKARRALFVSCISHFCRSQVMLWCSPEKWEQLHVVHCGVMPERYEPIEHGGRGSRVMFVGRLATAKGLPVLLQALAELKNRSPDVRLDLIGDGPDRRLLEEMVRALGLEPDVRFHGYQSQEQVSEHLRRADVFVTSSFAEGVPVALMEAMASGVPVIATSIAGIGELVNDGENGFLVPPGDVHALMDRIEIILSDSDLRNRFGRAGRSKVEREFNLHGEVSWLCRIMSSALEGRVEGVRPEKDPEERGDRAGRFQSALS